MARSRNIKPGFFTNDELVKLAYEYRLLFVGLWTLADREGRLLDRPIKIKMELFPADPVDVDTGLQALHDSGFILRYTVDGQRCIQILAWAKHQNPHQRESASALPPIGEAKDMPRHSLGDDKAKPRLGRARLIPDSGFLIPDSTEASASDADTSSEPKPDPIWGTGLAFLERKGIPEKQARSLLGKLKQACGDIQAGALLVEAESQDITEPAAWLMAAAAKRARAGPMKQQAMGKQAQGLMALEAMKSGNRMATGRTDNGVSEALLLGFEQNPGG